MKNLVLIYKNKDLNLGVKIYRNVQDRRTYYAIDKRWLNGNYGIDKDSIGIILDNNYYCKSNCYLPYELERYGYRDSKFIFISKAKYDINPEYYHNLIKNA